MDKIVLAALSTLLISLNCFAFTLKNSQISLNIIKLEGVKVTEDCQKNLKCKALMILKDKIVETQVEGKYVGHPAAHYCLDTKGIELIVRDEKLNEYDYCQYDDKSAIDSWDLYYAHHKKQMINSK